MGAVAAPHLRAEGEVVAPLAAETEPISVAASSRPPATNANCLRLRSLPHPHRRHARRSGCKVHPAAADLQADSPPKAGAS